MAGSSSCYNLYAWQRLSKERIRWLVVIVLMPKKQVREDTKRKKRRVR
jgi:hypothetical protein